MRTGINTGEVVAGDPTEGHAFATGEAVALAQRLEGAASPGEILLGEKTYRLVRDAILVEELEPLELKGRSTPVNAWRLLAVVTGAPAYARRLDSPMIGRQDELGRLREVFEETVRTQTCRLVTVLGPAGIGKSRLMNELLADTREEASVLLGRCLPYGEGITYWPLRDLVRDAARELSQEAIEKLLEGEPEAERIAAQSRERSASREVRLARGHDVGGAPPARAPGAGAAVDRQLRRPPVGRADLRRPDRVPLRLGARRADADRLPRAAGAARPPSCLDRPRRRDHARPALGAQAEELLEHPPRRDGSGRGILARITRAAEGNPLFVEQMLAMLTENGTASVDLAIPPTIHALLAARLDRLARDERAVIERASVIGKEFWRTAIAELSSDPERAAVGASLMTLARKELIEPAQSTFFSEDAFRFRHILIRDAAYLGIPKETRAELHERYADWLEDTVGDRSKELDEIIGYHLEQSHGYREELGPVAEGAALLATRGGERLAEAGVRALRRGDTSAAASLISRAVKLLPVDHPRRPELLTELASTLMRSGDFDRAAPVLDEAFESAVAIGDRRVELRTTIEQEFFRTFTAPEGSALEDSSVADRTIPLLEELGDDRGPGTSLAAEERARGERLQVGRPGRGARAGAGARTAGGRHRRGRRHDLHARAGALLRPHSGLRGHRSLRRIPRRVPGRPSARGLRRHGARGVEGHAGRVRRGERHVLAGPRGARGARPAFPDRDGRFADRRRHRAAGRAAERSGRGPQRGPTTRSGRWAR